MLAFVFVSLVVEVVSVAEERSSAGDCQRAVYVEIDAENRSVLDCRYIRLRLFLEGHVQIERSIPLVECSTRFFPFRGFPVRLERGVTCVTREDVLGSYTVFGRGERAVIVVERYRSPVVDDD